MSSVIDGLGVHERGVSGPCSSVGLDFGLCTPSEKLGHAYINLVDVGHDIGHFFNSFLDALAKLFVRKREISGTGGLEFRIFGFGHEEYAHYFIHFLSSND